MTSITEKVQPGWVLTGPKVLLIFFAFFGTIAAPNFLMVHYALSTFSGEQVDHPYEVGLAYNHEIEASQAQTALGWKVEANLHRLASGQAGLAVTAHAKDGQPLSALKVVGRLESPVDRQHDHTIVLSPTGEGEYGGSSNATAGQWDLLIEAADSTGAIRFRSHTRLTLD